MTVKLNLPPNVEQAFLGEAAARGLTPDQFASEVLLTRSAWQHGGMTIGSGLSARLQMEDGVPVLHNGQPTALHVIDDTLSGFN